MSKNSKIKPKILFKYRDDSTRTEDLIKKQTSLAFITITVK